MSFDVTLCADDYGMTEGVSRGILELACERRLSAASAMTNMPDWPQAAAVWRRNAPPAALGLHLNLTLGPPLASMPGFAPAGAFSSIATLVRARDLPVDEIRAEIVRQVDAFRQAVGRDPAHLDGHQHVQALPGIREALFAALSDCSLGGLLLRDSADLLWRIATRRYAARKAFAVALLGRGFRERALAAGFALNEGFAGFSRFDPSADLSRVFASYLRAPGSRHLVMCHPGYVDDALRMLDPVTETRARELAFLQSLRFADILAASGARMVVPAQATSRQG